MTRAFFVGADGAPRVSISNLKIDRFEVAGSSTRSDTASPARNSSRNRDPPSTSIDCPGTRASPPKAALPHLVADYHERRRLLTHFSARDAATEQWPHPKGGQQVVVDRGPDDALRIGRSGQHETPIPRRCLPS